MDYKDILVFLDASSDTENRLTAAVAIAQANGARLIGVDVTPSSVLESRWRDDALGLQDRFETRARQAGLTCEYLVANRTTPTWKSYYAHYCDLVVATQREDANAAFVPRAVPEQVLLSAGVPMLILPHDWRPSAIGESIVLAWNPSREATRAAHDALPLLRRAKRVTVFTFAPRADEGGSDPALMAAHLRHHGAPAEIYTWPDTGNMSAVDALFACLSTQEADLIVAGAYGHSRLFEGFFGGVSETLLRQPTMPVLMSH